MSEFWIIALSLLYLLLLFSIAYIGEKRANSQRSIVNNPYVYALSLTVFCTAWTYYGSVGKAANDGIEFLTTYIGPTISAPLWWIIIRKMIRICKTQHISTLADFISSRYGKNISLGIIVTVFSILGIVPYLAIQLKAISVSFFILSSNDFINPNSGHLNSFFFADTAFYLVIILALFTILFGTTSAEATEQHEGLVAAIAFEAIIKLLVFLAAGIFVTFFLFGGFTDIFQKAAANEELKKLFTFKKEFGFSNWFFLSMLSMLAIMFLPRQFQVTIVENLNEVHLKKAAWMFPAYLLLINLFVIPIAFAGKLIFSTQAVDADTYVLSLPLQQGQYFLALLVYLGGFSAATSMIIVAAIALSTMVSNNLLMPFLLKINSFDFSGKSNFSFLLILFRRIIIFLLLILAYLFYKLVAIHYSLVQIGFISFVAVAQFAPSIIFGLYWKRGNKYGAVSGILIGFLVWFVTLVIPTSLSAGFFPSDWATRGIFGWSLLHPYHLMGMRELDYISQAFFWSIFLNVSVYLGFSLFTKAGKVEQQQATIFVDIYKYSAFEAKGVVWKGLADTPNIHSLLINFLGKSRADEAMKEFSQQFPSSSSKNKKAPAALVEFAEKLLAGTIGAASARILIASVVREEEISQEKVLDMLKESQQVISLNKELEQKTRELEEVTHKLQEINQELVKVDALKSDFIATITHELRTPITSVKAFAEILFDTPEISEEEKLQFLDTIIKESERMERLINQVLELEKFESGKMHLEMTAIHLNQLIEKSIRTLQQTFKEKKISLSLDLNKDIPLTLGDYDKLVQVLLNLLSNAIKFCHPKKGVIVIRTFYFSELGHIQVEVENNGKGIVKEQQTLIFEKFFQAENNSTRKLKGSGLGLAITKKILDYHKGKIWVESIPEQFTKFSFLLPVISPELTYEKGIKKN